MNDSPNNTIVPGRFAMKILQMVVLICYGLIIHLFSFLVLYVKHTVFKVKLEPLEDPHLSRQVPSSTSDSDLHVPALTVSRVVDVVTEVEV